MMVKAFFISLIIALIVTPIMKKIAIKTNFVDYPIEKRKIHKKPIPVLGGLGILLSIFITTLFFNINITEVLLSPLFISGLLIVILGMIDDKINLRAIYKLIGQILIATFLVVSTQFTIDNISMFGINYIFSDFISYFLPIIWIVAMINAINLIDGMDGVAGGVSVIIIGVLITITLLNGSTIVFPFIIIGATLGFLFYNFHPSTIFLGDSGSMLLGMFIGIFGLLEMKSITVATTIPLLIVMSMPILDTLMAIGRRTITRQNIFKPDGRHLHHRLLKRGYNQRQIALIFYGLTLIYGLLAIILSISTNSSTQTIIYIILIIITIFIIEKIYITNPQFQIVSNIIRKLKRIRRMQ